MTCGCGEPATPHAHRRDGKPAVLDQSGPPLPAVELRCDNAACEWARTVRAESVPVAASPT